MMEERTLTVEKTWRSRAPMPARLWENMIREREALIEDACLEMFTDFACAAVSHGPMSIEVIFQSSMNPVKASRLSAARYQKSK